MQSRAKLTWFTLMMLSLSAEGLAGAQSAPARASDPALARIQQGTASVGPELEAARASLGGTAKKSDTGAPVDWDSLANHKAAAGTTVRGSFVLAGGAGAPIPSTAGGGDSLQSLHGDATGATATAAGSATRVVVPDAQVGGSSTSVPAPHAEAVIRGQINPAVRSCYQNDPDSKSKGPTRLAILIKLTPTGEVDSVSVSSNVAVSPSLASCVTAAAHAAKFAAPGANGATVRTALTFPGQDDEASSAAARPKGTPVTNAPGHAPRDTTNADTQPTNGETARR